MCTQLPARHRPLGWRTPGRKAAQAGNSKRFGGASMAWNEASGDCGALGGEGSQKPELQEAPANLRQRIWAVCCSGHVNLGSAARAWRLTSAPKLRPTGWRLVVRWCACDVSAHGLGRGRGHRHAGRARQHGHVRRVGLDSRATGAVRRQTHGDFGRSVPAPPLKWEGPIRRRVPGC